MCLITVCLCIAYGCALALVRQRLLPMVVLRVWFTVHLFAAVCICFVMCRIVRLFRYLGLLSPDASERWGRMCKSIVFTVFFRCCAHIRVRYAPGSLKASDLVGGAILSNHTSFFDSLFYLALAPLSFMMNTKTFLKSSLLDMPLFGYCLRCAGHFPVFFADENSPSFSVNREKQAAVAVEAERFLSSGGSISLFPEGVMNRAPAILRDFRLGSFRTIIDHKLPLTYLLVYGNHEVWNPSWRGVPGFPADLYVYIGRFDYDPATADPAHLSGAVRAEMQQHLDAMLAYRDDVDKYKPFYKAPAIEKKE